MSLRDIYDRYELDMAFSDLRKTASQLVEGAGSLNPLVLFIGEAPGADEDRVGEPFVGAAGQMLNELMRGVGLSRESGPRPCFVTNIVKYRPPGNRDPKPEEIQASIPYMLEEIEELNPSVVVTLGRHATNAFWKDAPAIGICHGWIRPLTNGGFHMPMYHPAYGVYDRRNRGKLEFDFRLLREELDHG